MRATYPITVKTDPMPRPRPRTPVHWGLALVYTAKSSDTGPQARGVGSYLFNLAANGGTIRDALGDGIDVSGTQIEFLLGAHAAHKF